MKLPVLSVILFVTLLLPATSRAQTRIKLKRADRLGIHHNSTGIDRIQGNVIFIHGNTTIHCDSAWFNKKENSLEAFGNVRMLVEGDTITGTRLKYDGNTNKAVLQSTTRSDCQGKLNGASD